MGTNKLNCRYLLACMNQFSLKPGLPPTESERLLRIMLFSDNLKLVKDEDSLKNLATKRRKLAHEFRAYRKRGMVPVFISFFPFLFALGVTLENAFGDVGAVATAHDLAIGLLVSWFPILILTSIVDKDILPAATGPARLKLNNLLESVRRALLDENLRNTYMKEENRTPDDFAWTAVLKDYNFGGKTGFFVSQAGQGRVRWHYGVANPIVTGIEEAFVAKKGRGWLGASAAEVQIARTALVLGPERGLFVEGLKFFDPREFWEVLSALIIVFGTIGGAWILSYYTPTLGLGCRSGGYTVFFIIACSMAILEALSWWLIPEPLGTLSPRYMRLADLPPANSSIGRFIQRLRVTLNNDPRSIFQTYIMRPMEVTNLGWLLYIVFAQVLGSYQNCRCLASVWAGKGGYVDFESQEYYKEHGIVLYWATGTAVSLFIMVSGLLYTIIVWCTQSHMNTLEYDDMTRGLMRIRTFKKVTLPLVMPFNWLLMAFGLLFDNIVPRRYQPRGRPSLIWSPWMKQTSITDILEAQLQAADGPKEVQGLKNEKIVRVRMIENGQ